MTWFLLNTICDTHWNYKNRVLYIAKIISQIKKKQKKNKQTLLWPCFDINDLQLPTSKYAEPKMGHN